MEKTDADGYQRVELYDGKREHDIAFRGRKIGSSQKADAWLTPKGTIAVYDYREQELYTYDEYGAFEDDEASTTSSGPTSRTCLARSTGKNSTSDQPDRNLL
jgi:hypothetical protein